MRPAVVDLLASAIAFDCDKLWRSPGDLLRLANAAIHPFDLQEAVRLLAASACGYMTQRAFIVRKTPFVFLKRVAYITFFFAVLPLVAVLWIDLRTEYAASPLATAVPSFSLFILLILGLLQFLIVVISFATWYFPTYLVNRDVVMYRPGLISPDRRLVETPQITGVDTRQGALARRFDYGSLVLSAAGDSVTIKDIHSPDKVAQTLLSLAASDSAPSMLQRLPARELIAQGENNQAEFKASLLWDYRREAVNKDLYEPVMKNIAAFMNTAGGALLIGVSDDGQVLGIERDYAGLPKKNVDGWENAFNMAFNQMIGAEMHHNVELEFEEIDGAVVCVALVQPSQIPCYLNFKGKEEFYIRTGNSSQPLSVSKATRYIQTRFTV